MTFVELGIGYLEFGLLRIGKYLPAETELQTVN